MARTGLPFAISACVIFVLFVPSGSVMAQCSDIDGDGFFDEAGCGTVVDLNDADPAVFPGATEGCDGFDNDCNGQIDDAAGCDTACSYPDALSEPSEASSGAVADRYPAVAWTGQQYGLAWSDWRNSFYLHIHFARLDAAGNKIGSDLPIVTRPVEAANPSMVWTGTEFGLVWEDYPGSEIGIAFVRLDANGNRIGQDITIASSSEFLQSPILVWTGREYGVAWSGDTGFNGVYFARLDAAGNRIGDVVPLRNASDLAFLSDLDWNGEEFVAAWTDHRLGDYPDQSEVYVARIAASGALIGEVRVTQADGRSESASLAWNGTEWGVAWADTRDAGWREIYFTRLDAAGNPIGSPIRITTSSAISQGARLTWNGSRYGLLWKETGTGLQFVQLDTSGAIQSGPVQLGEPPCHTGTDQPLWNGTEWFFAWKNCDSYQIDGVRVGCDCVDGDGDGSSVCRDCDDADDRVYPAAAQACDGINNDCDDPDWPGVPVTEIDGDGDTLPVCAGDCDDAAGTVYPAAPQLCDGLNNDCDDPGWPIVPALETDDDGDMLAECAGDCDDGRATVHPAAPQLCDGLNNDCDDALWPTPPGDETDQDLDGYRPCSGDCDDTAATVFPGAVEVCNGADDDCDDLVDEDADGEDSDGDTVANLCDNCPDEPNLDQLNSDTDSLGDLCDNCPTGRNEDQADGDSDALGDVCDNCPATSNVGQSDVDVDRVGDACDNCPLDANPGQSNLDGDEEGDRCDHDDGYVYVYFDVPVRVDWDPETTFEAWNCYRGDLAVVEATGVYTQAEGSNPIAGRICGTSIPTMDDPTPPEVMQVTFFLTAGISGGTEGSLGTDSTGAERPKHDPCP